VARRHPLRFAAARPSTGRGARCGTRRTEAETRVSFASSATSGCRHPKARAQAERARAHAARSPRQAEARARHAGNRCPHRSAWPHPERSACRAAALPASGTEQRCEDRAGDHRQRRQSRQRARRAQAAGADVAGFAGIPRAGRRLRRCRHRTRRRGRALCAGAAGAIGAVSCPGRAKRAPGPSGHERGSEDKPAQIGVLGEVADMLLDERGVDLDRFAGAIRRGE
jgi:hypothetical protein